MATVVNFIDVTLQSAASRTVNLPSAQILLTPNAPAFHVTAAGANTPASITFNATLLDLAGAISFACTGGTLTNITASSADLTYANLTGSSAVVTASIAVNGATFTAPCVISKVQDGTNGLNGISAAYVAVSGQQVFSRATAAAAFSPTSITLTATPFGGAATYQWQYWTGSAWANVASAGTAATYVVASGDFVDQRLYRIEATIGGTVYTDQFTMVQVTGGTNGINAITGFLTNESVTLAADNSGNVASFSQAVGVFELYDGITDKTTSGLVTYSLVSEIGCTVAINSSGAYSTSGMTADTASATLQAVYGTVTISKIFSLANSRSGSAGVPGAPGTPGVSAPLLGAARLYQWSPVAPATPTGTSTLTWATFANSAYTASDGWAVVAPANPGTPGLHLYVAEKPVTAAAGTTSSSVSYAGANISAWSQNGANGSNGSSGIQSATATVYQWAATIPAGPTGSATLTWPSSFGAAPTGYTLTPGTGSPGYTLWAAAVQITDTAGVATTSFNWASASVMAIGYAGTNGSGTPGADGASYVTAYCATSIGAGTSAPAATTGKTSLPATGSGGLTGAVYSASVPTLDSTHPYQMQSDGIYNPATNQVTWNTPYQSSLKVATLSAITANLGAVNAGSISLGGGVFSVDNSGNLVCHSITVYNPDGSVMFSAGGTLNPANAAVGTKNSDLTASISSAATTSTWTGTTGPGKPSDNATTNVTLVTRGSVSLAGNVATKSVGGASAYDSDVYSIDSYTGGAYASAIYPNSGDYIMMGLNSDPLTDSSYTSIDYGILVAAGIWYSYISGTGTSHGACAPNDSFAVTYDGVNVRWIRNGVITRTFASLVIVPLFFDSSFYTPGGVLKNICFGPMSNNDWGAIGGAAKAADNATVGAPSGTSVGGTEAGLLASRALNGDSAWNSLPGINTAIADKLSSTTASSLAATVTLTSSGSLLSGTPTNGTYQSPSGFYGVQGGVVKFSVPISGDPTFGGQLMAAYGSFGAVYVGSGGSLACGAYTNAAGYAWPASGTGFYLDSSGALFGNHAAGTWFQISNGNVYAPNFQIVSGLLTMTNPVINSPTLSAPTATGTAPITSTGASGTRTFTVNVTPASGRAPYSESWSIVGPDAASFKITAGDGTTSASLSATGTNVQYYVSARCAVTDANGQTVFFTCTLNVTFGTP